MLESADELRRRPAASESESVEAERTKSIGVPGDDARHFPGKV